MDHQWNTASINPCDASNPEQIPVNPAGRTNTHLIRCTTPVHPPARTNTHLIRCTTPVHPPGRTNTHLIRRTTPVFSCLIHQSQTGLQKEWPWYKLEVTYKVYHPVLYQFQGHLSPLSVLFSLKSIVEIAFCTPSLLTRPFWMSWNTVVTVVRFV